MLPSYAPPVYHSVENFQDYGLSSCIVPPPVFDPTDLPPPYSSQNPSLAESQYSLSSPESSTSQHQLSACQELTEIRFQAVHTSLQSAIYDQQPAVQGGETTATCTTPSGVIRLDGGDPPWDEHSEDVSRSTEHFSASSSSCLSSYSTNKTSLDREVRRASSIDSNDYETLTSKSRVAVPLKAHHPSCSTRTQRELSKLVPECTGSKARASSLGSAENASPDSRVSVHPVTALPSSSLRGTKVLSLRARCSLLGEASIYVNSFEVMPRPPPNVRVPADEPFKPFKTNNYFNTRIAEHRLRKGSDPLIGLYGKRRSPQGKERGKHRRRRHPHSAPKHKEKQSASCEVQTCQVNCAHEDPIPPGKETVV